VIDVADLLAWLGNPSEPGVSDLLTALEARAVDIVQQETERYFGVSVAHTEYLCGDGTLSLTLDEAPTVITSVDERSVVGGDWTTIAAGDDDGFEIRAPVSDSGRAVLLRKGGETWRHGYEYRVVYPFGYTAGQEPGDIRQAVMDLVAFKYNERGREGLRSETIGDYSYTALADSMGKRDLLSVPGLMRTLARWRGPVYA
jgi:hypothetical protein